MLMFDGARIERSHIWEKIIRNATKHTWRKKRILNYNI